MKREIKIKKITRVEGHGAVDILIENDKLKYVKLMLVEGPRFFEFITKGKMYYELPLIVSRICGICYVSHRLASVEAIEDAFGVEVPRPINLFRKLLTIGEFLESHALHQFFLALPDYMGYKSTLDMVKDYPNIVKRGFFLKEVGNRIMKLIGGKTIHGENTLVGGFNSLPSIDDLKRLKDDLEKSIPEIEDTIKLFDSFNYPVYNEKHPIEMCIEGNGLPLLGERLILSNGVTFTKREYELFVKETVSPYSMAKVSRINGMPFLVGPLARVNAHFRNFDERVTNLMKTLKVKFPSQNALHGNIARDIEMLQLTYEGIEIVSELISDYPKVTKVDNIKPKANTGYGIKEAPRGTLFHKYTFDETGRCTSTNIITPTAQLQSIVEKDLADFISMNATSSDDFLQKRSEMIIRAFDP